MIHQEPGDLPFQRLQRSFAAHLRDPDANPAPADIEDRRMGIYRDLFFNNVERFLQQGFPVLRSLYTETKWLRLARRYFAEHASQGPQFYQIAEEFLAWLSDEYQPSDDDPPFLLELAHYEWVELKLSLSDAETRIAPGVDPNGDLLAEIPVPSPVMMNLAYRWPVHEIGPNNRPRNPPQQPTHLIVHRDRDDRVRFLQINAVTSRLLQLMQAQPDATGRALLEQIAAELEHPNPAAVIDGGASTLADLRRRDILLGTRKPRA